MGTSEWFLIEKNETFLRYCRHCHGQHKHQVPKFKCSSNAPKGSSCEDVAHEPTKGCPIEPKSDYDGKPLCAIGQPLNGMDWHGKPGCAATTRLMNLDDIDFYNEGNQPVTGVTGSAKGKDFPSKQDFCYKKCKKHADVDVDSLFEHK